MRSTIIAIIVALVAGCLGVATAAGVSYAGQRVLANRMGIQQPGFNRGQRYGPNGMMPGNPGMMPWGNNQTNPRQQPRWNSPDRQNPYPNIPGNPGMMPGNPGMMPGNPGMMPWGNNQNCPGGAYPNQTPAPGQNPTPVPTLPQS